MPGASALFEGNHVSVYTHMTVARVLLEACTVAWWLDDPKIKTHERVQRGLSEQLYSAHQLAYLNMPGDDNAGRELFLTIPANPYTQSGVSVHRQGGRAAAGLWPI